MAFEPARKSVNSRPRTLTDRPATRLSEQIPPRFPELRLALEASQRELVRAFAREAALAEGAPLVAASAIADDIAEVWPSLCVDAPGGERAHVSLSSSRAELRAFVRLQGHARFAAVLPSLAGRARRDAGLSYRERGVDGWEIALHRSLRPESESDYSSQDAPSTAPAPAGGFRIDMAQANDAAAIARCFLAVYGHRYVHDEVYAPRRYWRKVENGELVPVVARDDRGEVVGHVALEREAGASIAERGEAVVLPAYRGHHLLELMTERLSEEAQKLGLVGIYARPVTLHTFSQRNDERAGMPVCAAMLGAAPEGARPKGLPAPTAGQRQSFLLAFRFLQTPAQQTIHAPAPYRDMLLKIYDRLGATVTTAEPSAAASGDSRANVKVDDRGYGTIHFETIGASAAIELKQALHDVQGIGARAVQLSAPVADPGLPSLAEAARALGFFFCGLGPAFADGADALLMQALSEPLDTAKLQLFTDFAKELVAFIDADRAAVGRAFGV